MKIINTSTVKPSDLSKWEADQVYNGLDCVITAEVLDALLPQLDDHTAATYAFSKALQGPALEMRLRGVLVDQSRKATVIDDYFTKIEHLNANLERIVFEGVGLPHFNWRSPADLKELFYNRLAIPEIKRGGRATVNRDALEKMEQYLIARQIVRHITTMRDLGKKISVLKTAIDPDGRIRTSYNIAGTSTGRFSSSLSEFGTGGNLQNIEEALRSMFIADPGMKWGKFDAAQIQSRIVGAAEWNILGDGTYLDTCESGDLHTGVAIMTWPELGWTGKPKIDREIADQLLYRHHTYRDACKVLGHGTNFDGMPATLSTQTRIPIRTVEDFQRKYHRAFPAHRAWRDWTDETLRAVGTYISIDGRKRQFWGRRNDPNIVREALAYEGQAAEAHIVNNGMLNIWHARDAVMIMHEHDGLVVGYPEEREDEVIPKIFKQLHHPVQLKNDRTLIIPYDCAVGWNRGAYSKDNVDGLKKYTGHDERRRSPKVGILDRSLR